MGGGNYTQVPTLLLKGKWLVEVGFNAGDYVEVNVENETITITKTTPPEVKEKESLEDKVKKLDKNQRAKLADLIDKL